MGRDRMGNEQIIDDFITPYLDPDINISIDLFNNYVALLFDIVLYVNANI